MTNLIVAFRNYANALKICVALCGLFQKLYLFKFVKVSYVRPVVTISSHAAL